MEGAQGGTPKGGAKGGAKGGTKGGATALFAPLTAWGVRSSPGPEVMMGKATDISSALLAMNQHVLAIAHMMPVGWESR